MASRRRLLPCLLGVALLAGLGGATRSAGAGHRSGPAISTPAPYALTKWDAESDNVVAAPGAVTLNGAPVTGVRVRVDAYELPSPTDAQGRFVYFADDTRVARHVVSIVDASRGRVGGKALTNEDQSALADRRASITVAYPIHELRVARDSAGRPVVSGRIASAGGTPPPVVALYSYELTGTVTDSGGKPVVGARVSTRTLDRDYWTVSSPTDARGRFTSLFTASSEAGGNPVSFTVRVSRGDLVYEFLAGELVDFQRLQSARVNIGLPPSGYAMTLPLPRSYAGAIYEGIVVGAARGGEPVRPVAATWPDEEGRFRIILPRSLAGQDVSLWEGSLDLFSQAPARPGRPIDLRDWPRVLAPNVPRDLARVRLRP